MCGIAGVIDPEGAAPQARLLARALVHRGPDGEGFFTSGPVALAMRRLAIIDPEGGDQPFFSRDGRVVAFQNGEIYNHHALRAELAAAGYRFRSRCDTEVLAHGYAHWGLPGLLDRLDGMFAFAILDRDRRRLFLARDRFGEKPLFLRADGHRLAFGSDLVGLAALDWGPWTIDRRALADVLTLGWVQGPRTLLAEVRRLPPGHWAAIDLDRPAPDVRPWVRPTVSPPAPVADRVVGATLDRAVVSRLEADRPMGVFLSGGIDSSLVAALAARHRHGLHAFSLTFGRPDLDESALAGRVAEAAGLTHHLVSFDADFGIDSFRAMLRRVDEPLADPAMFGHFLLSRAARDHVAVILTGAGGDEVFAGYDYQIPFLGGNGWRAPALIDESRGRTAGGHPLLCDYARRDRLMGGPVDSDPWSDTVMAALPEAATPLQRGRLAALATQIPDSYLAQLDRMTMAHGLEARVPLLAPAVVDLGLGLAEADLLTATGGKHVLRRLAADLLPETVARGAKRGFVLPFDRLVMAAVGSRGGIAGFLAGRPDTGLDPAGVRDLFNDIVRTGRMGRVAYSVVVLVEWLAAFRDRVADLRA